MWPTAGEYRRIHAHRIINNDRTQHKEFIHPSKCRTQTITKCDTLETLCHETVWYHCLSLRRRTQELAKRSPRTTEIAKGRDERQRQRQREGFVWNAWHNKPINQFSFPQYALPALLTESSLGHGLRYPFHYPKTQF